MDTVTGSSEMSISVEWFADGFIQVVGTIRMRNATTGLPCSDCQFSIDFPDGFHGIQRGFSPLNECECFIFGIGYDRVPAGNPRLVVIFGFAGEDPGSVSDVDIGEFDITGTNCDQCVFSPGINVKTVIGNGFNGRVTDLSVFKPANMDAWDPPTDCFTACAADVQNNYTPLDPWQQDTPDDCSTDDLTYVAN